MPPKISEHQSSEQSAPLGEVETQDRELPSVSVSKPEVADKSSSNFDPPTSSPSPLDMGTLEEGYETASEGAQRDSNVDTVAPKIPSSAPSLSGTKLRNRFSANPKMRRRLPTSETVPRSVDEIPQNSPDKGKARREHLKNPVPKKKSKIASDHGDDIANVGAISLDDKESSSPDIASTGSLFESFDSTTTPSKTYLYTNSKGLYANPIGLKSSSYTAQEDITIIEATSNKRFETANKKLFFELLSQMVVCFLTFYFIVFC